MNWELITKFIAAKFLKPDSVKTSRWFLTGIAVMGVVIGYLTGASNSPIAGVVISSIFGAALSVWVGRSLLLESPGPDTKRTSSDLEPIARIGGMAMTAFALFFVAGTFGGGWLRNAWPHFTRESHLTVPWVGSKSDPPATPLEAWKWITFSRDAAALGLDPQEIIQLYDRSKEAKAPLDEVIPWPSYRRGSPPKEEPVFIRSGKDEWP